MANDFRGNSRDRLQYDDMIDLLTSISFWFKPQEEFPDALFRVPSTGSVDATGRKFKTHCFLPADRSIMPSC
jgi:hypothetical protein